MRMLANSINVLGLTSNLYNMDGPFAVTIRSQAKQRNGTVF